MKSKQIFVSGKVQGVGFRNYTMKIASALEITGWARNLSSSDVEILACYAEESVFQKFLVELKKGPARSKVNNIEIIDVDSKSIHCDTFTIEPDGE
ncbi:MAG: acylphosphatase [Bdellovibrionota bacterium]